jgi:hypothetical protein
MVSPIQTTYGPHRATVRVAQVLLDAGATGTTTAVTWTGIAQRARDDPSPPREVTAQALKSHRTIPNFLARETVLADTICGDRRPNLGLSRGASFHGALSAATTADDRDQRRPHGQSTRGASIRSHRCPSTVQLSCAENGRPPCVQYSVPLASASECGSMSAADASNRSPELSRARTS